MIVSVVLIGIVFTALVVLITSNHQHMNAMGVFNMAGTTVVAMAAILSYLVGYESGQIDQASGVATVTLRALMTRTEEEVEHADNEDNLSV